MKNYLLSFRRAQQLVENYDPTSPEFESPGVAALAGQFKKTVLGHDPDNPESMWDTHHDKEAARSQLMGKIHDSFPYLNHSQALDMAARHMKVGKSPKHEHLAALGALFKSRDNSERGISFGTPFHAVRAAGFQRAVAHHYPSMDHSVEHFPESGITLVGFPNGEHMPPQEELPPEQPEAPPEAQSAPAEPGVDAGAPSAEARPVGDAIGAYLRTKQLVEARGGKAPARLR